MGLTTALGLGAAAVGAFANSKSQSKAAKNAANAQLQATESNNALARDIYGQNKAVLAPFVEQGGPASALLQGGLGYGDQDAFRGAFKDYIANSDYGFQFGEGANALNSGFAGAGTLQSGAAMKGLEDYRQNLQAGYRNEFMGALGGQQNLGFSAASAQTGVAQNMGNAVMANNQNAADARSNAALIKGQNNPFANALSMVGGGLFGLGR